MIAEIDGALMQLFHDGQHSGRRAGGNQKSASAAPGFHDTGSEGAGGAIRMPLWVPDRHSLWLDAQGSRGKPDLGPNFESTLAAAILAFNQSGGYLRFAIFLRPQQDAGISCSRLDFSSALRRLIS